MKPHDTRNKWYREKYGIDFAVELDALPPDVLKEKIEQSIRTYADIDELNTHIYKDRADKERWRTIIEYNNGTETDKWEWASSREMMNNEEGERLASTWLKAYLAKLA